MTLSDRFDRVEDVFIGLWRYRVKGEQVRWCATFCLDGLYYDTWPKDTKEQVLDEVWRVKRQNRQRRSKKKSKRKGSIR